MTSDTPPLSLSVDDLGAAVGDVLLGLRVSERNPALVGPDEGTLSAAVVLHGPSDISMVVSAPESVAHVLASAFFGLEDQALSSADVHDAVGELANICGGAVKPLLDGQWVIGVPDRDDPRTPDSASALEAKVPVGGGHVVVAMAQLSPN